MCAMSIYVALTDQHIEDMTWQIRVWQGVVRIRKPGKIRVFSDGASRGNPGPAAIAYAIFDDTGTLIESGAQTIGQATNNDAEYQALLLAMERARRLGTESVEFLLDSELVVKQVNGQYRARDGRMMVYLERVHSMLSSFKGMRITHIHREHEGARLVDGLVNEALDKAR